MKIFISIFLSLSVFCSCSNNAERKQIVKQKVTTEQILDTIIVKKNITNELPGGAYRKRATGYYVIIKNDTSSFMPIFYEYIDNEMIGISLHLPYKNNIEPYEKRLSELRLILSEADKEYNIDSLNSLVVGRLILSGDLAITITEEYKNKFGDNEKIALADYDKISNFLLESRLTKDLNEIFEPYSIAVDKIRIEHAFFATKDELLEFSNVSMDTIEIPNRILDFMSWIKFNNK